MELEERACVLDELLDELELDELLDELELDELLEELELDELELIPQNSLTFSFPT